MAALEVLTNEGIRALSAAASTGPRLVIEFACVGNKSDFGLAETVEAYAKLSAGDIPSWAASESDPTCTMPCVAMLPSVVTVDDSESSQLDPRNAIDAEFSWLPHESVEFDAVAVFARLYYIYAEYAVGQYVEGQVVWFQVDGVVTYYRCVQAVEVKYANISPAADPAHWVAIEVSPRVIGQDPPMRAESGPESLILLHVATTEQPVTVANGLEFNYKLRLFLDNEGSDLTGKDTCPVYLESLVPAGQAALQLGFLKEMAEAMRDMRSTVAKALGVGG